MLKNSKDMADTRDKHDGSIREFSSHSRFLTTASFLQKSLWLWKLNLGVESRSKKVGNLHPKVRKTASIFSVTQRKHPSELQHFCT